jgi:hypothetical protein
MKRKLGNHGRRESRSHLPIGRWFVPTTWPIVCTAESFLQSSTMSTALLSARSVLRLPVLYRTARTMSSASQLPVLPLQPPSLDEETAEFNARTSEMSSFFSLPRFASLKRPYPPSAVASKQGSLPVLPLPSTLLADKLYALLSKAASEDRPVHTMGAIDPVQMTQMARYQEVVYISGWAASSVLTTGNNEVGPDLGYVYLVPSIYFGLTLVSATTHIPPYQIKCTGYSGHNSCMTRNTTMNE